ncbi:MAG: LysM peptidoglycan-binding domain-containing protein [Gammaproteobacteria bacterium]|nr:LysM peptidoglycan-binding domain-containing protein [Gammaproteobacteria bacterium]MDH3756411.1 LysM peptidoglycan-binding domain-containing protein [Gammaproteobacteria bacterium]MDH3846166.1 LysM peptidoglycan-binding domain-containing protein [Gammaproteobacteria bacterium]MDH3864306.1 LysM peptidoglycan-binding domain-containing protein [Gammaproteobacteria bacterium]MDH3904070.1 LysM peptidoglycan-binding domain-containing protein [Gammaproteobacteria bacterium]
MVLPAHAEETFPLPEELRPDVDFWVSIFTRYGTDEGVLHDNRDLAVVYERIDIPTGISRKERNRRVKKRRDALVRILRSLADGKRDNLSAEEARVLALWPADVSDDTLRAATKRIRFQQGLSDRFREGLQRSGRWRDFIETEFAALGVPLELAALPHVESSYNPAARSHVGASGIWQFTRSTGRRFMRVDHVIDERNDPYAATRGAGRLLAYNYSITGNWPMAITAYNHGLAGVRRAMRIHGDTAYVDIFHNYNGRTFGFASRNFYLAFLAAKEVDQNPEHYFPGVVRESPTAYAELKLPDYVPAEELASALGVSSRYIAKHNLALQPTVWEGSKHLPRGYTVRLPESTLKQPADTLLASVPDDTWRTEQLPDLFHTVARGDTLSEIAARYDTRVSTLVALNGLGSRHRIRAGQELRLPAAGPAPEVVAVASSAPAQPEPEPEPIEPEMIVEEVPQVEEQEPAALAGDLAATVASTVQTALLSDPSDYTVAEDNTIEVQPLETLGHYADWLGLRTQRLRDVNGFAFRTPVEVGQRIKLEFGDVDVATFENLRVAYHRSQQDSFFRKHIITGVREHTIRSGESVWILSLREYDVPIWLFRQYNPGLDLHRITPGIKVRFPVLMATEQP